MKNLLFVVLLVLLGGSDFRYDIKKEQNTTTNDIIKNQIFCMSREGLFEVKSAIERNDPLIQTSFKKLCIPADKALVAGPFSVMQKLKSHRAETSTII